jgi:PAS domain S-box-containing protein
MIQNRDFSLFSDGMDFLLRDYTYKNDLFYDFIHLVHKALPLGGASFFSHNGERYISLASNNLNSVELSLLEEHLFSRSFPADQFYLEGSLKESEGEVFLRGSSYTYFSIAPLLSFCILYQEDVSIDMAALHSMVKLLKKKYCSDFECSEEPALPSVYPDLDPLSLFKSIPEPVFYKNSDFKYVECNQSFLEFCEFSREEVLGNSTYFLAGFEEAELHFEMDRQVMSTRSQLAYRSRFITKGGQIREVEITKTPYFDKSSSEFCGIVGVVKDITELVNTRKRYQEQNAELIKKNSELVIFQQKLVDVNEKLSEGEEKYRLLIENQKEFVIKLDGQGRRCTFISQSFMRFLDAKKKLTVNHDFFNFFDKSHILRLSDNLNSLQNTGEEFYFEAPMSGVKGQRWIAWSFKPFIEKGRIDFILAVGRDLTDQHKTELELDKYRRLMEAAFSQSPSPSLLIKYPEKVVMIINDSAQRFMEMPEENFVGRHVEECSLFKKTLISDSEEKLYDMVLSDELYHKAYSNIEIQREDRKGKTHYGLLFSTPIHDHIGELIAYLIIFPEITELKKAQIQLDAQNREMQKMQRLESIGVLAGGIAHDFNNIMSAVLGNISLLKMYGLSEKGEDLVGKAENAITRAKGLTNQLLSFSRGGAPVKKSAQLNEIVKESAIFSHHGSKVKVHFELSDTLDPVLLDAAQISQVVQNLVINAIQAMPEGGIVSILTQNVFFSDESLTHKEGNYVKVSVRDEGCGISEELGDTIFDPFFTTKEEGNGLGLATSYNIINKHQGFIEWDSGPWGTTFSFFLPAESGEAILEGPGAVERHRYSGNLLFMDDDPDLREVGVELFESIGFTVRTALDGEDALSQSKKIIAENRKFDIYIMDLTVPGAMGGGDIVDKLQEIDPKGRFILSSGYAESSFITHYKEIGFDGVLVKPYQRDDIYRLLKEIQYETVPKRDA